MSKLGLCPVCNARFTSTGICSNFACDNSEEIEVNSGSRVITTAEKVVDAAKPTEPNYQNVKVYCQEGKDNYILVPTKKKGDQIVAAGEDETLFYTRGGQVSSYQGRKLIVGVMADGKSTVQLAIFSASDIRKIDKMISVLNKNSAIVCIRLNVGDDGSVTKKILPIEEDTYIKRYNEFGQGVVGSVTDQKV